MLWKIIVKKMQGQPGILFLESAGLGMLICLNISALTRGDLGTALMLTFLMIVLTNSILKLGEEIGEEQRSGLYVYGLTFGTAAFLLISEQRVEFQLLGFVLFGLATSQLQPFLKVRGS